MILTCNINKDLPWTELNNIKNDLEIYLIKTFEEINITSNLIHNKKFDLILPNLTKEEQKKIKKENKKELIIQSSFDIIFKFDYSKNKIDIHSLKEELLENVFSFDSIFLEN